MQKNSLPIPLEEDEQSAVVQLLELYNLKFTAIPNSTYTTSQKQKNKNKTQGLRPGIPDLLIIIKNKLIFIEMKRVKGGKVSEEQKDWIEALNNLNPIVCAHVCKGFDEAKKTIDYYRFN